MAEPTQEEVNDLLHAKEQAEWAVAYMDAMVMGVQQIEGTRYKYRFNEAEPER